jgi:hypothetical protein
VGVLPLVPTIYEVLEELTLTVQRQLAADIPFCAFNGGNDVFVDVGNKSLGLEALMQYLGCEPVRRLSYILYPMSYVQGPDRHACSDTVHAQ